MALTVGFDATAAARQRAGIGRYTRNLLGQLIQQQDLEFRVFYCAGGVMRGSLPALNGSTRARPIPVSDRLANVIWHRAQIPIPVQLVLGDFDVFHSPDFTLPPVRRRPAVLTVHDLAFLRVPECAYPTLRRYLETVVPRSVRRADHVIAVSECTRRDVIELLGVPPNKVTTVYEAVGTELGPIHDIESRRVLQAAGIERPYLLSVGTLEPRKNYVRLLEAFKTLVDRGIEHDLIIAGSHGWMYEPIYERIDALRLRERVRIVLQPDDRRLRALYSRAAAFVYPSLYEGFGIPVLEAMACGTPVTCSETSSLGEVVGDAGLTFDPHDPDAIADAVRRLLEDAELAARLRSEGPRRAASFSWRRAAEETTAIYRLVSGRG